MDHRLVWDKVEVLGGGSYGLVCRAVNCKDPTLPNIAIKSCRMRNSDSLKKEKRILEDLEGLSPHIIMFLADATGFDPEVGSLYELLLEYAAGGTLSDIIRKRGGCLLEHEVKDFTRMILKGLSCVHQKGYVHRDLKPANILVVPLSNASNCLKIADFGLSKEPGEDMENGGSFKFRFRGTPLYMSPESFFLGKIETPLDIWSLACIVVEMITGDRAMQWVGPDMDFESSHDFFMQEPHIPEHMSDTGKDFLNKCFARNPSERWTAEMLLVHPYIRPGLKVLCRSRWRGGAHFLPHNLTLSR